MSKVTRRFGVSPSSSGRPPQNVRVKPETTGNLMTLLVHNTELFLIFLFICRIDSRKMFASIRDGWLPLSKYLTREQSYVCESKKKKGITNIRNRFVLFSYRRMFRINGSRKFHNILKNFRLGVASGISESFAISFVLCTICTCNISFS